MMLSIERWRAAVSHDPDEISRTFKKHCSRCDTWNQVTVHRVPTDGDWDEAHRYWQFSKVQRQERHGSDPEHQDRKGNCIVIEPRLA
jgi:hypothetical protein